MEEFGFDDLTSRIEPGPFALAGFSSETGDLIPLFHPYGCVPLRGIREKDQGGQRFLFPVEGECGSEGEGKDRIPVHGDEGAGLQELPGIPDSSPRAEDDRLHGEIDADGLSRPPCHALLDEFRMRVEIHDERFDARLPEELHVVRAQGAPQYRNNGLGQFIGERAQTGSQPGGKDHPLQGSASEAAFPASSERIGRSFRASGFIREFRSKFAERWATVGGMNRR